MSDRPSRDAHPRRRPALQLERRGEPLAPRHVFAQRLAWSALAAAGLLAASLGIGVLGYHHLVRLGWLDSLLNASMILGGMGPVDPVTSAAGKWFASAYALFSGVMILTSVGVLLAPALHRALHRFHLDLDDE
jgi:hypothetical protein